MDILWEKDLSVNGIRRDAVVRANIAEFAKLT